MKRRSRFAALLGLGITVTAASAVVLRSRAADDVPTMVVQRQRFVRRVTTEGGFRAVRSTPLTVPTQWHGRPYQIASLVANGSRVAEGDIVARFDPTDLERELVEGHADSDIADAKIAKAEAERQGALHNLDRDAVVSEHELEVAERFQATDGTLYSRMEILEDQIDTELAQEKTTHAQSKARSQDDLSRADIDLLTLEQRQADLRVDRAREGLHGLEITAPHAGIVVLERSWRGEIPRVGDTVWRGRALASIPDLSDMEAEVYVLEADAGGLEEGLEARVVVEAHPDTTYRAVVKAVDPIAQSRRSSSPVQFFRAVLELDRTDPAVMKPGQTVRAEILLEEHEAVIVVPRQAVCDDGGRPVVYRRAGRDFEPVEVSLGASGLGRVVISNGLNEGDVIALRDPKKIPGGDRSYPEGGSGLSMTGGGL